MSEQSSEALNAAETLAVDSGVHERASKKAPQRVVPILIVSDAPNLPTGLGRIARDLATRLWQRRTALGICVAQLGWGYDGSPWPWRVYPIKDTENWGKGDIVRTWNWILGELGQAEDEAGAVTLTIWDPGRCYGLHEQVSDWWAYCTLDSTNSTGTISGPAEEVLWEAVGSPRGKWECEEANAHMLPEFSRRILAYGSWGASVLERTLGNAHAPYLYLPHGLDLSVFKPAASRNTRPTIGCVAANTPRKDWGMVFQAVARARKYYPDLLLWAHVDKPVTAAWSLPQLALDYGFDKKSLAMTQELSDQELAGLYSSCWLTLAPGRGEGFCYPIAESLACGTPVLGSSYGGGADLLPKHLQVGHELLRVEGMFAQQRPVWDPLDWALRIGDVISGLKDGDANLQPEYLRGCVAHLDWPRLWPRWESWFREGIAEVRRNAQERYAAKTVEEEHSQ